MRFWDSSALIPLCLTQPLTARARQFYDEDPELAVWWASPVECASAFARLRREGVISADGEAAARVVLDRLADSWFEVQPASGMRHQAIRLLRLHPLRAADALQLAAGIEVAGLPPTGSFVTFDDRLRAAARLEGFSTP